MTQKRKNTKQQSQQLENRLQVQQRMVGQDSTNMLENNRYPNEGVNAANFPFRAFSNQSSTTTSAVNNNNKNGTRRSKSRKSR